MAISLTNRNLLRECTKDDASYQRLLAAFEATTTLPAMEPIYHLFNTFLPETVIWIDTGGTIAYITEKCWDLLGYEARELHGRKWETLCHPDDILTLYQVIEHLRASDETQKVQHRFLHENGRYVWVETTCCATRSETTGEIEGFLGITHDITQQRLIEAERNASEKKFFSAFHASPLPQFIGTFDEGRIIEANQAFADLLSIDRAAILGHTTVELGVAVDVALRERLYAELRQTGSLREVEYQFRGSDGGVRTVLLSAERLEMHHQPCWLGMYYDITERKQVEEALATERRLLRILIDNLPHFIYYKDTQARFLISNNANTKVLGLSSESQAIGKSDLDFYPPTMANQFYTDDMGVIQSGQPLINREEVGRDMEGNSRWVLTSKFPLHGRDEEIIGLVGIGIDITERKQAEAALRASEERFHKAFWSSPFGMVIAELPSQRIIDANPVTLNIGHLSREEIIGRTAEEVGFVLEPAVQAEFNRQLMEEGRVRNLEAAWTRHEKRTIVKVAAEMIDIMGVPHLLVMFDDVTALKQAEQARLEKERLETALEKERELGDLKTRMMQRISHEFRTPLAVIQTSTGLILKYHDRLASEQREELTRRVEGQVTSLTDMLSNISQIVRGEFQDLVFKAERVDIVALAQASIQYIQLIDHDNHPLYLETLAPVLEIMGDPQHLRSLLTNLLTNAVIYSPHSRPVVLSLVGNASSVCIRVKDEGIGILPEEIGRVTEPFFRGTNFDERPGLGLGMTNAKHIIDLHHGTLQVESYPNLGTTVEVCLPLELKSGLF